MKTHEKELQKLFHATISSIVIGASLLFLDKISDFWNSMIGAEGNLTSKIAFVIFLLITSFVTSGLKNGIDLIDLWLSNFRNKTRMRELQSRLNKIRNEIIDSSRKFKSSKQSFFVRVDAAGRNVSLLQPSSRDFYVSKENATINILKLKDIYNENFDTIERLISSAIEDIDAAEKVFLEAKKWGDEDFQAFSDQENQDF